ncbi:uncharacterized protein LOC127863849 isoform X1 [Dreissena polymorpha]|uniref:uncharacterized protein LOC127863849 isoform X1 n=1 Tax=Dreissena polymorpha TaxID=45954 RepID=UPI002265177A|nr:uncharacterized protein LOC127863849 isoform X1 [Dreissena polymorpha]
MPKSSQTLKKGVVTEDEVRPTSSGHRSGSQCSLPTGVRSGPQCAFRTPARCSIVTVYNLEQRLVGVGRDVPDRDAVYTLGRESAQLFRHQTLPKGYTNILAFDPDSKSYHWCALGGTGSSTEVYYVNSRPTSGRCRPFAAGPDRSSISLEQPVSPFQYQKLLALGFRPSTLLLDPDCVYDATSHRGCSTHAPRSRKESPQKPDATSGTAARSAVDPQIRLSRCSPHGFSDAATPDDLACPEADVMRSDNIDRIAPSLHMRSDTSPSRPNAAVFSFRNNENVSHSKVQHLIQTQRSSAKYPVQCPRYPVIATSCQILLGRRILYYSGC